MTVARRSYKNDVDRRMHDIVGAVTSGDFPEMDLIKLSRRHLDHWIAELRTGETGVRRLRKRLEALRDGSSVRACPQCGRPVTGRADKVYCETDCRVRAHRSRTP